jgi:3-hydroxyisobutyrate dehydrogenase-like beta-hydroxyacid dehydrogenase
VQADGETLRTIGFVGLGDMGAPIAANYARTGFDLLAYDLRPEVESQSSFGADAGQKMQLT